MAAKSPPNPSKHTFSCTETTFQSSAPPFKIIYFNCFLESGFLPSTLSSKQMACVRECQGGQSTYSLSLSLAKHYLLPLAFEILVVIKENVCLKT